LLIGCLLAGAGIGLAGTAECTLVAVSLPDDIRGIGATVVVGLLWGPFTTRWIRKAALWLAGCGLGLLCR
jgi:hypothetical protein